MKPPGRPIIASMESLTNGLSTYVDTFLQPLVQTLPSYIRDSSQLLDTFKTYTWEHSYIWLSRDVQSLYTSIPHGVSLAVLSHFIGTYS